MDGRWDNVDDTNMILYRGDRKSEIKNSSNFWYEGLLINSANGGNPKTISTRGIFELISMHIHPELDEGSYHRVSDFMSFTKDKEIALKYIDKNSE